jgi:hypothetical protein
MEREGLPAAIPGGLASLIPGVGGLSPDQCPVASLPFIVIFCAFVRARLDNAPKTTMPRQKAGTLIRTCGEGGK